MSQSNSVKRDYSECPFCGAAETTEGQYRCGTTFDSDSPGNWDQRCQDAYAACESFEDCCKVLFETNAEMRRFFGADN